ncbi:MAG: lactate 2-monooxygenase [Salinisphaeraceae bacterium]|nr:lactate 2-monooxygenase [Salinisphaeraceae bacterium]
MSTPDREIRTTLPVARQQAIYVGGLAGQQPKVPVHPARLEQAAAARLTPEAYAYIAGGAGREDTMRNNLTAFDRWRIQPRMLRNVAQRDTGVELFGRRLPSPFLLCPIGVLELAHEQADLAVARAAAAEDIPMIFSSQASRSMEDCAAQMGAAPRWFQLYWSKSDALVRSFVSRAEANGCEAIVVTLDTTLLGWRTRDLDAAHLPFLHGRGIAQYTSDPVFMAALDEPLDADSQAARPPLNLNTLRSVLQAARRFPEGTLHSLSNGRALAAVRRFIATYSRPSLTWDDLSFLREITDLPIVLKGILCAEDARLAVSHGVDGIIVSNHGGRQVDGAVATLEQLPGIVDAVDQRLPVIMDSGIRGGADMFKALALGATAVGLGRPYCYGLALAGEDGVREVIANFKADFDLTMALSGCTRVADISRECLVEQ